ncbi:hypothetical protein [Sphingomonas nostoxanthinifaciens]|nr:hypothetical protein [Sphingomonas nostoxanthinifaciens]UAK23657.1 hypothetical protein K8P63_14885 [Sphingomonas nostoxanthinifaciens]
MRPSSVCISVAQVDNATERLSRMFYSNSDPERFSREKPDLVREMRGWKR